MDKLQHIKNLILKLNEARFNYEQLNKTIISDLEYDKLYDELVLLEKETGIVFSNSPTMNVGYEVLSDLKKIKHDKKMLSLDKTKDVLKLQSFLDKQIGILSYKLDGLTIVLTYSNGELLKAVTRGNGEIGEDITNNVKVFKNVPLKISYKDELIIRGEGIISFLEFDKINSFLDDDLKYKNPRNLCSGTVRQLNNEIVAKRNVDFYAFSLVTSDDVDFKNEKKNQLQFLENLGFTVVAYKIVDDKNVSDAVLSFKEDIKNNDFASDGLVLTYNDILYSDSLGETSKFPKDSIAFKWEDEKAETTLLDIFWSASRTGLLNPVAIFSPVSLEGTTVNRASLHNVSIVKELNLGIGDTITVYKANMIIPQVAENLTNIGGVFIPDKCPDCGANTEIRKVKEGEALYCTNDNCVAKTVQSLVHFVSRDALNIEGLSEETLKKFHELEIVSNYVDIFKLEKYSERIKDMEGFGVRSYNKLIKSIDKSKDCELANFIYSLGINQVGLSSAKLLCKKIDNNPLEIPNVDYDTLISIDGFGDIISNSIINYFKDDLNLKLYNEMIEILKFKQLNIVVDSKLDGLVFVITGDLVNFKNRNELKSVIESFGGTVTGSVSKKTTALINNDIFSPSSKNEKAKSLDIDILTEEQFVDKYL